MTPHEEFCDLAERYSIEWCNHYGEPGYTNPAKGILLANWNDVPQEIQDQLESEGYELEWSDEWTVIYETGKAYRTSPDCYSWTPYYVTMDNGEDIGGDEIESGDQAERFIEEYLLNNPRHCNVFSKLDLAQYGFRLAWPQAHDCETGWHVGMDDKPETLLAKARAQFPGHDVAFELTEASQFYCTWRTWIRAQDWEG